MNEFTPLQQRSFQDMLAAERRLRTELENERKHLVRLLEDAAWRWYGPYLETLRREDPGLPKEWGAQEWSRFFAAAPLAIPVELPSHWGQPGANGHTNGNGHEHRHHSLSPGPSLEKAEEGLRAELQTRNQDLLTQVRALTNEIRRLQTTSSPAHRPPTLSSTAPLPLGPLAGFSLPARPLRFQKAFSGWNDLQWRRGMMIVFLVARQGLSAFMEISAHVTRAENLSDRSNSVKQPLEDLVKASFLEAETLTVDLGDKKPALKLIRFTPLGRDLCQALGWETLESEWEQLIRLHEGVRFPEHTVAVLAFAMNARVRGWQVTLLPEVPGHAAPDVLVVNGAEQHYVEVELGLKDRPAKWRNLAQLQGHVALCARDASGRTRLINDCRLAKLSGMATDLETLVLTVPYRDLTQEHPLWVEMWN